MKYYQKLAMMPTFTFQDASNIFGSALKASKHLNTMVNEDSVHRIRQNLYTCVNFATGDDYASRFQIASNITPDSFISFHSAFEFYGFYSQLFFEIQVCSTKRFLSFSYGDYSYVGFKIDSLAQVGKIQGVRVATIERTIVDSINMLGRVMDVEELVKCLNLVHQINEDKVLEMLALYDREILYRKVGYILSFYKERLNISDYFFNRCKLLSNKMNKGFLVANDKKSLVYNADWGIYAYGDLTKLMNKGGDEDV